MNARSSIRRLASPLAIFVAAALAITATNAAQAATMQGSGQSPLSQVAGAYNSSAGVQLRSQLASIFSDPALPTAARSLLQSDGPSGKNDLTDFQADLLKALIAETADPSLLAARLTGKPLTVRQMVEAAILQQKLQVNPAITTLARAGQQLRKSPQLPADIASVVTNNSTGYSAFTPPATANQGGSAALDTVLGDIATLRTGQAFTTYASSLVPVLQNPQFPNLLKSQSSLDIAAFLPASSMIALLIPNDHDPALTDVVKATLEILGGLATLGGLLMTGPIVIGGITITATGLFIFAAISGITIGVIDLATSLDCDHDGDPFDPADTPGQEC